MFIKLKKCKMALSASKKIPGGIMIRNKRTVNVMFAKGGSGSLHTKLNVPITWIRAMGITQEEREVEILFDGEKITIQKKEG